MEHRVGICACYDTQNYGSMLQAYATQFIINKLGFDNEFIIYKKKLTPWFLLRSLPRMFNGCLIQEKKMVITKNLSIRKNKMAREGNAIRKQAFIRFQKRYYKSFSPVFYGYRELTEGAGRYSTVLAGSDQLWSPSGLPTNFYNLRFVRGDTNKISYATSFGVRQIPWYQKRRTRDFLNRIQHLSVREYGGQEIIYQLTGRKAKIVCDPTLLLTVQQWEKAVPPRQICEEPYIFCYFLGTNAQHRELAREFKSRTGLQIVSTPFLDSFVPEDVEFGDYRLFDIGPDDFINLIRNAAYIFTDSFHGTVFSIMNHKKFITFHRYGNSKKGSRNSRVDSLCKLLGVEGQLYDENRTNQVENNIDYAGVDKRLEELRADSIQYLKSSLENLKM